MKPGDALNSLPSRIRAALMNEYQLISQNYFEHRWRPAELSAGRFCEITYTIVKGHGEGSFPSRISKPRDFVGACRQLESVTSVPRSFQILIPRLLPALYEVRNNRGVGHVGGDVDSNAIDASFVFASCNWVVAELVRVFHDLSIEQAQLIVDQLAEIKIPLVWGEDNIKRILSPAVDLEQSILIFLTVSPGNIKISDLKRWTEYKNNTRFNAKLKELHKKRLIEFDQSSRVAQILPPGAKVAAALIKRLTEST